MENTTKTIKKTTSDTISKEKTTTTSHFDYDKTTTESPTRRVGGYQGNSTYQNRGGSNSTGKPFTPYNKQTKYFKRKKFCKLCAKGIEHLDYKDVDTLNKYLNYSLKISSRKLTGACSSHQRKISNAIKRARIVALIPFVKE